jgi:cobalt-zinc-cadmium efflux system outer membrane protein
MKYSILWVPFVMTFFAAGYANPRSSFASPPVAKLNPAQIVLRGETPAELTPAEPADSITLDWVLDAAINRHPSLAVTWYEIKARQGAAQQAGLLPNPVLFGEMEEFGGSGDFSGTGAMSSRIGISQEFPMGGKIGKRVREAEAAAKVSDLEHQAKVIEVRALVERRFFDVFTLQERLNLQTEQMELIKKTHDVVVKRVKIGDTSPLDLARSQVELASARIEIEQTRKELESARYVLAESWGSKSPVFSTVSAHYQSDPNLTEQELKGALEQSPAWRLLEEQFAKADAALDLARAQSIPDIELEGGVQRFNESDDHAFFLGVSIPLPLFDRNQGGIAEAKATTRKAHHQREAGFLALHTKFQEAWRKLVSTRQAVQSLETEVLPAAQNAYESISKAYKAGEVDILGLLDAQRTWAEIRKTRLGLLHELESSRIEIKRLIGEGAAVSSASLSNNNSYN